MTSTPQPGDALKAAEFARLMGEPIGCRLCGHPLQGKHLQCVNLKCVWLGTTLADQAGIENRSPEDASNG
jgi:hypothetical protein